MYSDRMKYYASLAKARKSRLLVFVTGDRPGMETQIAPDAVELIGNLLDHYEGCPKISLLLYTRGGDTLAAWSLANLLREFCKKLEVIVPSKCHSAGTLICLGADKVVMTKQATLSPIDPSINTPLNPQHPGAPPHQRLPVSVEDVAGFFQMAKSEAGITQPELLAQVFMKLATDVHPIALGRVNRARAQIQQLARKLLSNHTTDSKKVKKIIDALCVEAGSHDYMIYRDEARRVLGLQIETPTMDFYQELKALYLNIREELQLDIPFNPATQAQATPVDYSITRVLIETEKNGGFHYVRNGTLSQIQVPGGGIGIQDKVNFEGWRAVT